MSSQKTDIEILRGKTIDHAFFWRNPTDNTMTFEFYTDKEECFALVLKAQPLVDIVAAEKIYSKRERELYSHDEVAPNEDTIFEL